jgi:hypothetical protein
MVFKIPAATSGLLSYPWLEYSAGNSEHRGSFCDAGGEKANPGPETGYGIEGHPPYGNQKGEDFSRGSFSRQNNPAAFHEIEVTHVIACIEDILSFINMKPLGMLGQFGKG